MTNAETAVVRLLSFKFKDKLRQYFNNLADKVMSDDSYLENTNCLPACPDCCYIAAGKSLSVSYADYFNRLAYELLTKDEVFNNLSNCIKENKGLVIKLLSSQFSKNELTDILHSIEKVHLEPGSESVKRVFNKDLEKGAILTNSHNHYINSPLKFIVYYSLLRLVWDEKKDSVNQDELDFDSSKWDFAFDNSFVSCPLWYGKCITYDFNTPRPWPCVDHNCSKCITICSKKDLFDKFNELLPMIKQRDKKAAKAWSEQLKSTL